jgi:DNA replication and repair protein RecF
VLVHDAADVFRVVATVAGMKGSEEIAVAYQRGGRKKITLDGSPLRLSDMYDRYTAVSIGPEDSEILSGAPSSRRFYLDLHLSQQSTRYISLLSDYQRALAQKNAALKSEQDCSAFDELLVKTGSVIIAERQKFIHAVQALAGENYRDLSDGSSLTLDYQPALSNWSDLSDASDISEKFVEAIAAVKKREYALQSAIVGPHRDDIRIAIDAYPARTHASQGEWRTAAIALKLAVYHLLSESRGIRPVLLLDEIFAELDANRTSRLVASFGSFGQIFLTTADGPPEGLISDCRSFWIRGGNVAETQ